MWLEHDEVVAEAVAGRQAASSLLEPTQAESLVPVWWRQASLLHDAKAYHILGP